MQKDSHPKTPPYLYKILSVDHWEKSQTTHQVHVSADDKAFIHLCTLEQLNKTIAKHWSNVDDFFVLTLEADKLKGNLVLETSSNDSHKHYHLYDGHIPMQAVIHAALCHPTS